METTDRNLAKLTAEAGALGMRVESDRDTVHLLDDEGPLATAHLIETADEALDGRWIIAKWSPVHSRWQSRDIKRGAAPGLGTMYHVTSGPTLRSLAEMGIRTYPTPRAALKRWLVDAPPRRG